MNVKVFMQEFEMKMESLQQRQEELERKEFKLKGSLLKFDKFLKVSIQIRAANFSSQLTNQLLKGLNPVKYIVIRKKVAETLARLKMIF